MPVADGSGATPEERIEEARKELEANLKAEILDRVRQMPPADFEQLIIQLLVRMNYGQGREELAKALGGSGDGGVDGVVHQDPLGLDRVYIQASDTKRGTTSDPKPSTASSAPWTSRRRIRACSSRRLASRSRPASMQRPQASTSS